MFDISKNFSKLVVSGNYDASATSVLISGSNLLSKIPASGSGIFSAVWYNATDYPSVYNDPNKEIVRVTGLSGNTFFVNRGREYTSPSLHSGTNKVHKMIVTPTARGFNNLYYFRNPEKSYYMFEDFLGTAGAIEGWTTVSVAGATLTSRPFLPSTFGVWQRFISTGATSVNSLGYGLDAYILDSGLMVLESMCSFADKIPSGGNPFFSTFGFQDNTSAPANNSHCAVILIDSGSFNYQIRHERAGTATTLTTSTVYTTGWHKINIVVHPTGAYVDYYIDDVLIGSLSGQVPITSTSDLRFTLGRETGVYDLTMTTSGLIDYVSLYKEIQPVTAGYGATGYNYRL